MQVAGQFLGDKASAARGAVNDFFTDPTAHKVPTRNLHNDGMLYNRAYVEDLRRKLDSFFALIIRNLRDSIPKAIGFFLVRGLEEKMQ